jgi:hypothetical protein
MHRRSFIAALVAALATKQLPALLPAEPGLVLRAERRFSSPFNDFASLTVEVQLAWSERAARGMRNREAHDPFDGLVGEFYIADSSPVEIPDHLPGTVTTYETVVGVAAHEGIVQVGGFRRETFVWTVRVNSGPVNYAIEAAEAIAGFDLPAAAQVRLAPSLLQGLLPTPADFSRKVEIEAEQDPIAADSSPLRYRYGYDER